VDVVTGLKDLNRNGFQTSSSWLGISSDDSPLALRDVSSYDIYSLDWALPWKTKLLRQLESDPWWHSSIRRFAMGGHNHTTWTSTISLVNPLGFRQGWRHFQPRQSAARAEAQFLKATAVSAPAMLARSNQCCTANDSRPGVQSGRIIRGSALQSLHTFPSSDKTRIVLAGTPASGPELFHWVQSTGLNCSYEANRRNIRFILLSEPRRDLARTITCDSLSLLGSAND